jgi:hypothetical protein
MKQRAHAFVALLFPLSPHDEACAEFTLRVDCLQVGKLAAFRNVAAESE